MLSAQAPRAADPMFQAMRDEIDRARKLTLPNLEAPYFVEYAIDEEENFAVSATLGGLLSRRKDRFRSPDVHVRVGDYKFDNSNYVGSGFGFGSRYDLERFPLEDSYPLLRRYFWLMTDSAYKSAVEAISRKRAAHAQHAAERAAQRFRACRAGEIRAAHQAPGDRRGAVGRPRADALRDLRPVPRGEELRAWNWKSAKADCTW